MRILRIVSQLFEDITPSLVLPHQGGGKIGWYSEKAVGKTWFDRPREPKPSRGIGDTAIQIQILQEQNPSDHGARTPCFRAAKKLQGGKMKKWSNTGFVPKWVQWYYRWEKSERLVALFWGALVGMFCALLFMAQQNNRPVTGLLFGAVIAWALGGMVIRVRAEAEQSKAKRWVEDQLKNLLEVRAVADGPPIKATIPLACLAHIVHLQPKEAPAAIRTWFWNASELVDFVFPGMDIKLTVEGMRRICPLRYLENVEEEYAPPKPLLNLALALEKAKEKEGKAA